MTSPVRNDNSNEKWDNSIEEDASTEQNAKVQSASEVIPTCGYSTSSSSVPPVQPVGQWCNIEGPALCFSAYMGGIAVPCSERIDADVSGASLTQFAKKSPRLEVNELLQVLPRWAQTILKSEVKSSSGEVDFAKWIIDKNCQNEREFLNAYSLLNINIQYAFLVTLMNCNNPQATQLLAAIFRSE